MSSGRPMRLRATFVLLGAILIAAQNLAAPVTLAAAGPAGVVSLPVYVGYAAGKVTSKLIPKPWLGSPNVNFVGRTNKYDDGAIRIDNTSPTPFTVDDVSVTIGPYSYDLWGTGLTVPANGSLILTGTSATGYNFDTSRTPNANCTNTGYVPQISVTTGGSTQTFADTGQVLNTGGIDPASCGGGNESEPWAAVGGPPRQSTDWPTFHHDNNRSGVSSDFTVGAAKARNLSLKWATTVGGGGSGHAFIYSSPAVVYNATLGKSLVYIASGQKPSAVDAIDAATGAIVWKFTVVGGVVWSSPAVAGNTVYFGGKDHKLYAVDATTGQLQCSYDTGGVLYASPVVADVDGTGLVVFEGENGVSDMMSAGHMWAINGVGNTGGDCTPKWSFNGFLNKGPSGTRTGVYANAALGKDATGRPLVVFGTGNPDDAVYALDARDGSLVWHFQTLITDGDQDVGATPAITGPGVNGFPDGVVYINGKDRIEYALNLLTGAKIWEFDMGLDSGDTVSDSQAATAIYGQKVYVNYATWVYSLSAKTGAKVWRSLPTAAVTVSSVSLSGRRGDGVIFLGDESGTEYAYQLSNGKLIFHYSVGGTAAIVSSAAVSAGMVFFGATDGNLYALG